MPDNVVEKEKNLLNEKDLKSEKYEYAKILFKKEDSNIDKIIEKDLDSIKKAINAFITKDDTLSYSKQNTKIILNNNNHSKNVIKITYRIKENKNKIRLFGKEFYERYKNKCKITINDELIELKEFLEFTSDLEIIKFHWDDNLTDLSYMFADCSELVSITNAKNLINDNVTNLSNFFRNCKSLTNINDISYWNTENVSNMSSLFRGCKSLDNLVELNNWETSNVILMTSLFYECEKLTQLNIS